ncbi:MAG TPA: hypothetical protein VGW78_05260 [Candidatus Babeliales bacterium]|jgi:hypothetical protein|nr:hypothetical protein [Candidatus Babeliales bacterium]
MKKNVYTLLAGTFLFAASTQATPQGPSIGEEIKVYLAGLGLLAAGSAIGWSVYNYGQRFTKAIIAGGITAAVTWNFANRAALSGLLSNLANAASVPLIKENSILNVTPAAILGSVTAGMLAFYAIYAYFHTDDYKHSSTVKTQTWYRY